MTHEELVRALLAAQPKPEATLKDAFTSEEWSEMLNQSITCTRHMLRKLCRAGTMEGTRDWRETSVGYMQRYPVFRLVRP